MVCSALGEGAVTYETCEKWYQRFWDGNFDLSDRKRSTTRKKSENEELKQRFQKNPRRSPRKIARQVDVTQPTTSNHLHKPGRIQKADQRAPHVLSSKDKKSRHDKTRRYVGFW